MARHYYSLENQIKQQITMVTNFNANVGARHKILTFKKNN